MSVWSTTIQHAKRQLSETLEVAQSVVMEVLKGREDLLFNSANVLTSDFGFLDAIFTEDSATITSTLENHGSRVDADLMALINLAGDVTSSTTDGLLAGSSFPYPNLVEQTLQQGGASSMILVNQQLYQVLAVIVEAPQPIAIAVIGFRIDADFLARLKSITLLETTITAMSGDNMLFERTTLSDKQAIFSETTSVDDLSWLSFILLNQANLISQSVPLISNESLQVALGLSENSQRLFSEFSQLQLQISIIAILCLFISLLLGAAVARRLSSPLKRLAEITQRIANGDYAEPIEIKSNTTEIAELSSSFLSMQSNIKLREEQIQYQAQHDLLTGLFNRYQVTELLNHLFAQQSEFQVVGINILGFRGINDVFGHHNGDTCLKVVAERLSRLGGTAARLNGGEFLWLPETPIDETVLQNVQGKLQTPIEIESVVIPLRMSFGVVHCPEDSDDSATLLKRLAITLDQARSVVGNCVRYNADFDAQYTRRITIITELKKAVLSNSAELSLSYQPKLELSSGKVTHAEALMRWNSEILGFVPPDEFIQVAEQAGLIGAVTEWVVKRAVEDAHYFKQQELELCIAINLSAKDILDPQLLPKIQALIEQYNLSETQLAFEITESDLVTDAVKAVQELNTYREAGFTLAIDDFGTGYSSLAYLKSLPVTDLKIDKSFVLNLDTNENDQQIVQTIIGLAHSFGLSVIAEGVENARSLAMLHRWHCEYIQGYHICRPLPRADFIQWHNENASNNWLH
ncbi:GGDEF domain-containing phosphodiesterase [Alteromonas flava]|uniref:bifunctional diguanylate cyclase/phosphodiesterase n=1 Tax=Alteromonas flava TaxID=2048003 RepID=UPI001F0BE5EE|nr:GGDEF domain-containing phosphodiesterase [Alteromonas flava]